MSAHAILRPAHVHTVVPAPESFCYFVDSSSREGVWWNVDARTKRCTCPAGRKATAGSKPCRHLSAVYEFEGARQAAREIPQAPKCCRGVGCRECGYTGTREGYEHRRGFRPSLEAQVRLATAVLAGEH